MSNDEHHAGERTRLVLGFMSGTSLDGLDAALVEVTGVGLGLRARPLGFDSAGFGPLGDRLRSLAEGAGLGAREIASLSLEFSRLHAALGGRLVGRARCDLACVHGQTVFHAPPLSWQLLTPAVIAEGLGCRVISDLRSADIAAGGEGAPITPLADAVLFAHPGRSRAVVNLGGFVNITLLPAGRAADAGYADGVRGFDVGPCNHLLDAAARLGLGRPYDDGGRAAAGAAPDTRAEEAMARVLKGTSVGEGQTRSLGTADSGIAAVEGLLGNGVGADAIARAAADGIARAVHRVIGGAMDRIAGAGGVDEVLIAGGGVLNEYLRGRIEAGRVPVLVTDDVGVPTGAREAVCMAVLGALSVDGVSVTLPAVTGRRPGACVCGSQTLGGGGAEGCG